jgi:hypothetical protein
MLILDETRGFIVQGLTVATSAERNREGLLRRLVTQIGVITKRGTV